MKTIYILFGILVLFSGCTQVVKNNSATNQAYASSCAGYLEGTQPYTTCVLQASKMDEEKERATQQRNEMFHTVRGRDLRNKQETHNKP